jgi:hypothetical protein
MESYSKKIKTGEDEMLGENIVEYTNNFFRNGEREILNSENILKEKNENTENEIFNLETFSEWRPNAEENLREVKETDRLEKNKLKNIESLKPESDYVENYVKRMNKNLFIQMLKEKELIFVDGLNLFNWEDYYNVLSDPVTMNLIQRLNLPALSGAYDSVLFHLDKIKKGYELESRKKLNIIKDICYVMRALIFRSRMKNKNYLEPKFVIVYRVPKREAESFEYDEQDNYVIKIHTQGYKSEVDDILVVFLFYLSLNVPNFIRSSILTADNYKWAEYFNLKEQKNRKTLIILDENNMYNLDHYSRSTAIMRKSSDDAEIESAVVGANFTGGIWGYPDTIPPRKMKK